MDNYICQVEEVLTHDGNKRGQDSKMQVRNFSLRERSDMLSASDGGEGYGKADVVREVA